MTTQVPGSLPPMWVTQVEFPAPGYSLSQPWLVWAFEPAEGKSLSNFAFQRKKKKLHPILEPLGQFVTQVPTPDPHPSSGSLLMQALGGHSDSSSNRIPVTHIGGQAGVPGFLAACCGHLGNEPMDGTHSPN